MGVFVHAKPLQSCLTLCDPIDGSPPGSPVPDIIQALFWKYQDVQMGQWSLSLLSLEVSGVDG